MRIFLTGATGYIGSAVAWALLQRGHRVLGLTHSKEKAPHLSDRGIEPVTGDLRRPADYREAAESCDVLIHAGFEYGGAAQETDRTAVDTLLAAARAAGRPRLFLYTSGVWVLGRRGDAPADEGTLPAPLKIVHWRPEHERLTLRAAGGQVSAAVLRPGCVYGGQAGLYGKMIESVYAGRKITLVGRGTNRWASVYLDDLADLYSLVVDAWPREALYHATDGSAEPLRRAAEAILDAAGGGTVESVSLAEARAAMGDYADALALDQVVSSRRARRELGWRPRLDSPSAHAELLLKQWHEKASPYSVA